MNRAALEVLLPFAIAFVLGWGVNGWRLGERAAKLEQQHTAERLAAAEAARAQEQTLVAAAAAADQLHSGELTSAELKIRDLEQRVAVGTGRLSVAARCPAARVPETAATAGVGDRSERAELDPVARPAYFALRRGLAAAEQALKLCVSVHQVR